MLAHAAKRLLRTRRRPILVESPIPSSAVIFLRSSPNRQPAPVAAAFSLGFAKTKALSIELRGRRQDGGLTGTRAESRSAGGVSKPSRRDTRPPVPRQSAAALRGAAGALLPVPPCRLGQLLIAPAARATLPPRWACRKALTGLLPSLASSCNAGQTTTAVRFRRGALGGHRQGPPTWSHAPNERLDNLGSSRPVGEAGHLPPDAGEYAAPRAESIVGCRLTLAWQQPRRFKPGRGALSTRRQATMPIAAVCGMGREDSLPNRCLGAEGALAGASRVRLPGGGLARRRHGWRREGQGESTAEEQSQRTQAGAPNPKATGRVTRPAVRFAIVLHPYLPLPRAPRVRRAGSFAYYLVGRESQPNPSAAHDATLSFTSAPRRELPRGAGCFS